MNQKIIDLYDEYTHKPLKREEFMRRLVELTGSIAAALTVLPLIEMPTSYQPLIPADDPNLVASEVTYPSGDITMKGYLVMPNSTEKRGAVIIIHENRGLNEHIRDVARRVAKAGYIALAPDGLSPLGGTPADSDVARSLFPKLDMPTTIQNFVNAIGFLQSLSVSNGKVGCVGFCWGGAMANNLAIHADKLACAVAYYGRQPDNARVKEIRARVMLHYAGLDEGVNKGMDSYETALKEAKISYEQFIYEGAQHAFNNDTSTARYNAEVAQLAWSRTLRLFQEVL
ncbi:MAG: dienelactone hydrolase family protein [Spirosomataceae bacterium]